MKANEIEALIDEAHRVATTEKEPERLRRQLGYLLMSALERVEPVSWEVKTKGGQVECRIANWYFTLDLSSQAEPDRTIPKERIERQAENLRFALSRMQDGRPRKIYQD